MCHKGEREGEGERDVGRKRYPLIEIPPPPPPPPPTPNQASSQLLSM